MSVQIPWCLAASSLGRQSPFLGAPLSAMGPQAGAVCSLLFLLRALAEPAENSDFSLAGDYLLGGLFTLHANVKGTVHLSLLQVPRCKE